MGRGEAFTAYIGAELKGLIASRGRSAAAVARETGHSASALNRWLNGRQALPLPVLLEACDVLGVEPREVVSRAYARLGAEGAGRGGRAGLRVVDGGAGRDGIATSGAGAGGAEEQETAPPPDTEAHKVGDRPKDTAAPPWDGGAAARRPGRLRTRAGAASVSVTASSVAGVWQPWRTLREEHPDVVVHYAAPLPALVLGVTDGRSIWLARGLLQVEERCTLAHELIHIERGHRGCQPPRIEADVEREAARRLIPLDLLGEALTWARCEAETADELCVDIATLRTRLADLTRAERARLRRRLADLSAP